MRYNRGDIYWIEMEGEMPTGHAMWGNRPAIIVSNNDTNYTSPVLEIVYLTTSQRPDTPTHCHIQSAKNPSTAICEQITTVDKSMVGKYVGSCTEEEMENVDRCILASLGIEPPAHADKTIERLYKDELERYRHRESFFIETIQNLSSKSM